MELLPIYLRHESTTDKVAINCQARYGGVLPKDVVGYRDSACTRPAARWPWYYSASKPRRGCSFVSLNCFYWEARWLPEQDD